MQCGILLAAAMLMPFVGMAAGATKDGGPDDVAKKASYVDSLRNGNNVYSDRKAASVVDYLGHICNEEPRDSVRLYVAEALLNYNWYLMQNGEWYLCSRLLKNALRYCPPQKERLRCQIETAIAGVRLYDGDYKGAEPLLLKANKYFESRGDTTEWLKTCVNLGLYYSRTHNKKMALEYYGKVMKVAAREPYQSYYSIVTGYAEKIEEDSTINLANFEKSLAISLDNGYTFLLASNYNDLARYYYRMENYHESMANARKALKFAEKYNQNDMRVLALGIMADIYYQQKNYVAAYRMEADKNYLLQKSREGFGKNIFSHLQMADSMVNWINCNVPLGADGELGAPAENRKRHGWLWGIVWMVVGAMAAIMVIWFANRNKVAAEGEYAPGKGESDEENAPMAVANEVVSAEEKEGRGDSTAGEENLLMYLQIVEESFNPTLDRIRQMIKELPKTGNQDMDAKVRNIMSHLLQSRLPENKAIAGLQEVEARFTQRLSATYPSLTKNDLRMAHYIKCGLTLPQISALSGLQPKSVNQARYRLRKSLGLGQDESLESFIMAF